MLAGKLANMKNGILADCDYILISKSYGKSNSCDRWKFGNGAGCLPGLVNKELQRNILFPVTRIARAGESGRTRTEK